MNQNNIMESTQNLPKKQEEEKIKNPNIRDLNIKSAGDAYVHKIRIYIIKIIVEILLILLCIGGVFSLKDIDIKNTKKQEMRVSAINGEIKKLESDTSNIKSKIAEVKKYEKRWGKSYLDLSSLDKFDADHLKKILESSAKQYKIYDLKITNDKGRNVTVKSVNLSRLKLNVVTGTISFYAMTDLYGIDFIENMINNLSGFFIIENLKITKEKSKYNLKDIIQIKKDNYDKYIINFNISYAWYSIRRK